VGGVYLYGKGRGKGARDRKRSWGYQGSKKPLRAKKLREIPRNSLVTGGGESSEGEDKITKPGTRTQIPEGEPRTRRLRI